MASRPSRFSRRTFLSTAGTASAFVWIPKPVNGYSPADMAILIDDDQAALKTKGVIALQIEQYGAGKISFRNIWLKQ